MVTIFWPNKHYLQLDVDDYVALLRAKKPQTDLSKGNDYTFVNLPHRSQPIAVHRFITKAKSNQTVDHIDGNAHNSCRANLRFVSRKQNNMNQVKRTKTSSKYKGVSLLQRDNIWVVYCNRKYLGRFQSEDEAAIAYNKSAVEQFGQYAKLNDIKT